MTDRVRSFRPRRVIVLLAIAVAIGALVPAIGLTQGDGRGPRPDLMISSASAPPNFASPGERFRVSFTIANEGSRNVNRSSVVRAYLSPGRGRSEDDVPLEAARSVPGIRAGSDFSARLSLRVPAGHPSGLFFVVVCADATSRVDESDDRFNCLYSGQFMRVGPAGNGPGGPRGPAGERGPRGEPGPPSVETYTLPRTTMAMGSPNVHDLVDDDDPDVPDEGSTENQEVLKVGPFTFRTLCRTHVSGEPENSDEAKILVYTDSGTMSFEGRQGSRTNVPAGTGRPGATGAGGGEGKHQIIATERDQDEGWGDGDEQLVSGLNEASVYLVHSSGWEVVFEGYAGVDTLGVGVPGPDNGDNCVFGGGATVVAKPAAR